MSKDGGAAFPLVSGNSGNIFIKGDEKGLSVRQFYKAALAGATPIKTTVEPERFAEYIAELADALIAEDEAHAGNGEK